MGDDDRKLDWGGSKWWQNTVGKGEKRLEVHKKKKLDDAELAMKSQRGDVENSSE